MIKAAGTYTVMVKWMTNHGPSDNEIIYRGLKSYFDDKELGRLVLNFENYDLWLFTRHMATFQIEPDADAAPTHV